MLLLVAVTTLLEVAPPSLLPPAVTVELVVFGVPPIPVLVVPPIDVEVVSLLELVEPPELELVESVPSLGAPPAPESP